jgi:uncharacterized membrane protein YkvA (DUF1232 family)
MIMANREPVPYGPDTGEGALAEMVKRLKLVWLLFRDSRIPFLTKLVIPLSLLYLVSPIDFVPAAFVPVLGGLDDLGVILLAMALFVKLSPPQIVEQYLHQLEYGRVRESEPEFVDTTYRIVDED